MPGELQYSYGALAQSVEHLTFNQVVRGSNPRCFTRTSLGLFFIYADVAELADALDLGSSGRPCRFDSCHPHVIGRAVALTIKNREAAALFSCN